MKIRDEINLEELLRFGFKKVISNEDLPLFKLDWNNVTDEDIEIAKIKERELLKTHVVIDGLCDLAKYYFNLKTYIYTIDSSRRGQYYYILIKPEDRRLKIYASKPDGDGGVVNLGNILLILFQNNFIELC